MKIVVELASFPMGELRTEEHFVSWTKFVTEELPCRTEAEVRVISYGFSEPCVTNRITVEMPQDWIRVSELRRQILAGDKERFEILKLINDLWKEWSDENRR